MACNNNNNNSNNNLINTLISNVGRVVTVFTQSGGASGCGFTGLLVQVNCDCIKLVTELPCAPSQPFGLNINNQNFRKNKCCGNEFGTTCVVPINSIASFVCNQF